MAEQKKTGNPQGEPSIIEIIQGMVKEGESEETILQTLSQLGVDLKKAKRLLLLAQADTFALLRSEISKVVQQDVEKEKQNINQYIQQTALESVQKVKQNVTDEIKSDLQKFENEIMQNRKRYESQSSQTVQKFTELVERMRLRVNTLGKDVSQVRMDQDELKLKGIGKQNRLTSWILLAFGVLFIIVDLYLFIVGFGSALTIDAILTFIVIALIGVTMLFVATLI
jgi:VIT1/CCC1 family predicted Fe2+/Mn2+ transporter